MNIFLDPPIHKFKFLKPLPHPFKTLVSPTLWLILELSLAMVTQNRQLSQGENEDMKLIFFNSFLLYKVNYKWNNMVECYFVSTNSCESKILTQKLPIYFRAQLFKTNDVVS